MRLSNQEGDETKTRQVPHRYCLPCRSVATPPLKSLAFPACCGTFCTQHPENKHHQALLLPSTPTPSIPPLVGAALSSNWVLFWRVHEVFEEANEGPWARDKVS